MHMQCSGDLGALCMALEHAHRLAVHDDAHLRLARLLCVRDERSLPVLHCRKCLVIKLVPVALRSQRRAHPHGDVHKEVARIVIVNVSVLPIGSEANRGKGVDAALVLAKQALPSEPLRAKDATVSCMSSA